MGYINYYLSVMNDKQFAWVILLGFIVIGSLIYLATAAIMGDYGAKTQQVGTIAFFAALGLSVCVLIYNTVAFYLGFFWLLLSGLKDGIGWAVNKIRG